jgi:hypothetical protein
VYTGWETDGQVYFGRIDPRTGYVSDILAPQAPIERENTRRWP